MENFAGSLLAVEIEQESLKPNYDHWRLLEIACDPLLIPWLFFLGGGGRGGGIFQGERKQTED